MDLRLLITFREVARLGSVSAAASELLVSQPALSRQIQQLERALGLSLFTRTGRNLQLTAAGRQFLTACESVLSAVDSAESLASSLAAGRLSHVHVVAPATTLTDVVAPFLAELRPHDPLITVDEGSYATALASLGMAADLVVLTAPPPRTLSTTVIAELPVWAYVPAQSPLATRQELTVAELAREQLIVLDATARPRRLLDEAFISEGVTTSNPVECRNAQVAQALAAAGRGVAVVSDDPRFDLVPLPIGSRHGRLRITLHAAWDPAHHAASELSLVAERLAAFCTARYGPVVADAGSGA